MVLVRIAYAADLPTPDEVIRSLDENGQASRVQAPAPAVPPAAAASPPRFEAPRSRRRASDLAWRPRAALAPSSDPSARLPARCAPSAPALVVGRFADLIALAARSATSASSSRSSATCGWCASRTAGWKSRSSRARRRRWSTISRASSRSGPAGAGWSWSRPSRARRRSSRRRGPQGRARDGVRADPLVQAVLARFPGAEIVGVRKGEMPWCRRRTMPVTDRN